jgi:hypothetical protein
MTGQKMGPVICALFVVNWFSLKPITIRKRRHILSGTRGEIIKSPVTHDAGIARNFDKNVFKTESEAKRPVSFIFASNDRTRRVDIVDAVRLRDREISPEDDED